jgi:hypothetical protein
MRSWTLGALVFPLLLVLPSGAARGADPPRRRPLGPEERTAVLMLIKAVDLAQETDVTGDQLGWQHHVLKGPHTTAYVPFRIEFGALAEAIKSGALYVRAVSRHDGLRAKDERSVLRDWLLHAGDVGPRPQEAVVVPAGDMPVGGPAIRSRRDDVAAAAASSAVLALQQRAYDRQKEADDAARKRVEKPEPNPYVVPFEEYYFFDAKSRGFQAKAIERALALPPGDYDVFVGLIDRGHVKTSSPAVIRRTVTVPDLWEQFAISSLILVSDVHAMPAPLGPQQQSERPYAFGRSEIMPRTTLAFTTSDVLSVVLQVCNYGAPDAELTVEYNFFHDVNGKRTLFNRTEPQILGDQDLPAPAPWETQAFVMQTVALGSFPPGQYELEVTARDRLIRASAKNAVAFTVGVR